MTQVYRCVVSIVYLLLLLDIIQSFLRVIVHARFHYLFKPINIPCRGLFILLIVSNFKKDPPRGSVHLSFAVNKLVKRNKQVHVLFTKHCRHATTVFSVHIVLPV